MPITAAAAAAAAAAGETASCPTERLAYLMQFRRPDGGHPLSACKLPQHEERADNALPRSKEAHVMRAICAHVRVLRDIMAQCSPR